MPPTDEQQVTCWSTCDDLAMGDTALATRMSLMFAQGRDEKVVVGASVQDAQNDDSAGEDRPGQDAREANGTINVLLAAGNDSRGGLCSIVLALTVVHFGRWNCWLIHALV